MAKGNFLLDDSWESLFAGLPDAAAGQLIKAAFSYHTGGDVEIEDPILCAVFDMIKAKIDENDRNYERQCEKNKDNVRKRWNTDVYDRIPNDTTVYEPIRNDTDSDSDNDNELKEKSTLKSAKKEKHVHGEYKHVRLTDEEHDKLVEQYGEATTNDAIKLLDEYIEEKGTKYKSHYLTMKRWVFSAVEERRQKPQAPPGRKTNRFVNFDRNKDNDALMAQIIARAEGRIV